MTEQKQPLVFHPPLFAIHPALALYGSNVSILNAEDIVLPIGILAAIALAIWGVLGFALKDAARAGAAVSLAVLATFSYKGLSTASAKLNLIGQGQGFPIWLWAAGTLAIVLLVLRKHASTVPLARFLNFVGVVIVGFALGGIVVSHWAIRGALAKSVSASAGEVAAGIVERPPDIFYVVLDGYGRSDTFERLYGFSDQDFIRELEDRGFYVAERSHSNYAQTELSLASALNLAPVQDLLTKMGDGARERAVLDTMIDRNRLIQLLRKHDYRFYAVTTGFPALLFRNADVRFQAGDSRAIYVNALFSRTPFRMPQGVLSSQFDNRRDYIEGGFEKLADLGSPDSVPKFVFAHILAPHPPFVFGPNGEPRQPKGAFGLFDGSKYLESVGTREEYRRGYRDQAAYIRKLTLQAVDAILQHDTADPIIVLQGDHGPKSSVHMDRIEETDLHELFGILLALRAPEGVASKLYPEITPVNTFRLLLSEELGEELPPLPDRSYYSPWDNPLDLTDVTEQLKEPPGEDLEGANEVLAKVSAG